MLTNIKFKIIKLLKKIINNTLLSCNISYIMVEIDSNIINIRQIFDTKICNMKYIVTSIAIPQHIKVVCMKEQ